MFPVQKQIWKIMVAGPVIMTAPAALNPTGIRLNFAVFFRQLDWTTMSTPVFLATHLKNIANLIFPEHHFHNFVCVVASE
jgi:hypothetical protein